MAIITCPKCGAQISEEAEKCPQCGNIINEKQRQLQNGGNKRRIKIALVSETVLLAVAIVLAIVFWANGFNDKNMVNAVVALDAGIQLTTENISYISIKHLYDAIDTKAAEQPRRYAMLQKEAHEFETECNKLFNGIRRIKVQCLNKSDETIDASNIENDTCTAKNPDDTYAASSVFGDDKMGDSLRIWMENFRDVVLNMRVFRTDKNDPDSPIDTASSFYKRTANSIATSDIYVNHSMKQSFVKDMPLVGTLALLSKLQSDIRNVEAEVLQQMVAKLEDYVTEDLKDMLQEWLDKDVNIIHYHAPELVKLENKLDDMARARGDMVGYFDEDTWFLLQEEFLGRQVVDNVSMLSTTTAEANITIYYGNNKDNRRVSLEKVSGTWEIVDFWYSDGGKSFKEKCEDGIKEMEERGNGSNQQYEKDDLSWIQGNWRYVARIYGVTVEERIGIYENMIVVMYDGEFDYRGSYTIEGNQLVYYYGDGTAGYIIIDRVNRRLMFDDTHAFQRF